MQLQAWSGRLLKVLGVGAQQPTAVQGTELTSDRCYVVGDVHGRADLLALLHSAIDADQTRRSDLKSVEVYLGDLVDRGPNSKDVIAALIQRSIDHRVVYIRGNHEEMMLKAIAGTLSMRRWKHIGGSQTLISYGVQKNLVSATEREDLLLGVLRDAVPPAHLGFINSSVEYCLWKNYVFVHAGLRPGIKLRSQNRSDLLSIREPFLSQGPKSRCVVVHGHSPTPQPDIRLDISRVGIDTEAYLSGVLTCLKLDDSGMNFIQVGSGKERNS